MTDIPPGFHLIDRMDEVAGAFHPLYLSRRDEDGAMAIGFRVGPQHCNPRGHCHGGAWATVADIIMGMNVATLTGLSGPTISMTIDFLGSASAGQWVEGHVRVLRATPNLGFAECHFTADGDLVLRASATFRRKLPPFRGFDDLVVQERPETETTNWEKRT